MVTAESYVYYDWKKKAYFAVTVYDTGDKLIEPMKPFLIEHANSYDENRCKTLDDELNGRSTE